MQLWLVYQALNINACLLHTDACSEDYLLSTPDKRLEELDWNDRFADSLSLSDDGAPEHSPQISPASVLSSATTSPIKVAYVATRHQICDVHNKSDCSTVSLAPAIYQC